MFLLASGLGLIDATRPGTNQPRTLVQPRSHQHGRDPAVQRYRQRLGTAHPHRAPARGAPARAPLAPEFPRFAAAAPFETLPLSEMPSLAASRARPSPKEPVFTVAAALLVLHQMRRNAHSVSQLRDHPLPLRPTRPTSTPRTAFSNRPLDEKAMGFSGGRQEGDRLPGGRQLPVQAGLAPRARLPV